MVGETPGIAGNLEVESSLQYKYLINLIKQSDTEVYLHSAHVRNILSIFLTKLVELGKLDSEYANLILSSAILHDLGKLLIPKHILHCEDKLSDLDFKLIKAHSAAGELVLKSEITNQLPEEFIDISCKVARSHHEKMNGTGYPDNLHGNEIPLEARVLAIADVYEALRSIRAYKMAYSHKEAISIMKDTENEHLDSELLNIFIKIQCYKYGF